ncbi:hypothetical protein D3C71_1080630 [compost metagenome]
MRLISHKFSDLINLDVKEGRRLSVKRGNYRDFVCLILVESAGNARVIPNTCFRPDPNFNAQIYSVNHEFYAD